MNKIKKLKISIDEMHIAGTFKGLHLGLHWWILCLFGPFGTLLRRKHSTLNDK
jgi:hypothetical protein